MPIPMACFAIAKVLEGLDYAHRKRDPLGRPLEIVHRDCSPQNVLVSYEGEVKVIDFGIAKATSRNSRTMAGVRAAAIASSLRLGVYPPLTVGRRRCRALATLK